MSDNKQYCKKSTELTELIWSTWNMIFSLLLAYSFDCSQRFSITSSSRNSSKSLCGAKSTSLGTLRFSNSIFSCCAIGISFLVHYLGNKLLTMKFSISFVEASIKSSARVSSLSNVVKIWGSGAFISISNVSDLVHHSNNQKIQYLWLFVWMTDCQYYLIKKSNLLLKML